jgi:hypothetical protein
LPCRQQRHEERGTFPLAHLLEPNSDARRE